MSQEIKPALTNQDVRFEVKSTTKKLQLEKYPDGDLEITINEHRDYTTFFIDSDERKRLISWLTVLETIV